MALCREFSMSTVCLHSSFGLAYIRNVKKFIVYSFFSVLVVLFDVDFVIDIAENFVRLIFCFN